MQAVKNLTKQQNEGLDFFWTSVTINKNIEQAMENYRYGSAMVS